MINKVILENFQSHKFTEFVLEPHLNVIVGASNVGKTALSRALSLVLYNTWDKSWVRVGSAFCKITLVMDNGVTVIREKGEKVNKYVLQIPNKPPQEFVNFGTDVPEAISKVLHIGKISLDKDDSLTLNYASQLEPLFLFNRSGSQKAKVFGRLSGAHYLDYALRNLNTEKKQLSIEKNLKGKELEDLKTQHAALSAVSEFRPKIEELGAKSVALDVASLRVVGLKALFIRSQDWKRRYGTEIAKENVLVQSKAVEIGPIEASVQRLRELRQLLDWKSDILSKEKALNDAKTPLEMEFKATTTEYASILEQNKVCPVCFGTIDIAKMIEIKNNLAGKEKCHI